MRILSPLSSEKEKLKETIDTLHQSLSSVEDELNTISLQWDSKWQGISEDISNWQEATLEDIEAKIVSIKQELPDRSELEEWEKKNKYSARRGGKVKERACSSRGRKRSSFERRGRKAE